MVPSIKTAVSSLLFVSSCANLVNGAAVARSPNCDGLDAAECVAKEHADFQSLSPISQGDLDGFVKRDDSKLSDVESLVPISQGDFPGMVKRGDGTESREFTPVTGIDGGVVQRMPIGQLRGQQPDTFNMFVLGLDRLMNLGENKELSWFKLAGIHGLPFEPWQYPDSATANPGLGYCTHSSSIFLTWHRPYLLLIEQMINSEAVAVANEFSGDQKDKYLAAAQKVRFPYWDWSATGTHSRIPDVMKEERISVVTPGGQETIDNPLFGYKFAGNPPDGFGPVTTRGPNDQKLQDTYPGRRQGTLDYFSRDNFNPASEYLEGIHGGVHVFIGGDMPIIPRSSFDPLFWLHHCNIDRLTAMYQATHPGVTLSPRKRSPTFALGGDGPDDIDTPLHPFRHPNGNEWTSRDVSSAGSIHQHGYAYPEVPAGMSQQELKTFTTRKVNEAYAPNTQSKGFSDNQSRDLISSIVSRNEWDALVEFDMAELSGPSYQISIYLDPIDCNITEEAQVPENLAGAAAIFAGMTNPVEMPTGKVTQTVPLTPKLVERTDDLTAHLVSPLLMNQMSWSVEQVCPDTGNILPMDVDSIKSLKVSVVSRTAEYSTDMSELPKKMDELLHLDPTDGKLGGLSAGDPLPQILEGVEGILDLVGDVFECVGDAIGDLGDKLTPN